MLCYEIFLNGNKLYLVGHKKAERLGVSIFYGKGMPQPHLYTDSMFRVSDVFVRDGRWKPVPLHIGDEVSINLVEASTPDIPDKCISYGSKLDEAGQAELFCSFCGTSEHDVKKIAKGLSANICDECFRLMREELKDADG